MANSSNCGSLGENKINGKPIKHGLDISFNGELVLITDSYFYDIGVLKPTDDGRFEISTIQITPNEDIDEWIQYSLDNKEPNIFPSVRCIDANCIHVATSSRRFIHLSANRNYFEPISLQQMFENQVNSLPHDMIVMECRGIPT